ncbi:DUF262 domain-containing protein [Vibrio sp. 10N.286.46.A8]|uniref:DUF262 domain-containing protein n=2 Tax=Vibrio TaxID=662 RepID=UPI00352F2AAE
MATEIQDKIVEQIESASHTVRTDGYSMSIGELVNLYRDGDLILDPAYQRLFRWEDHQKTKLIESILIGIPIPELFVAQNEDHTWNIVDGVQRLSTIFQLFGVLEGHDPLVLDTCNYIPALEGQTWDTLPMSTQRLIRRSKLSVSIILSQSSTEAPYELFQRLNTGGSHLTAQEVRNCVILMIDASFFDILNDLKNFPEFLSCISLKEDDLEKEEHMELILRTFIGYTNKVNYSSYGSINKIVLDDFIDKETVRLIEVADREAFINDFKATFILLDRLLSDSSFKKFDGTRFRGSFNVSVYEMLTIGISKNISSLEEKCDDEICQLIKDIYSEQAVTDSFRRGVRAIKRYKDINQFTIEYFS